MKQGRETDETHRKKNKHWKSHGRYTQVKTKEKHARRKPMIKDTQRKKHR